MQKILKMTWCCRTFFFIQPLREFNYGDSVFVISCKGFILPSLPEIVHTLTSANLTLWHMPTIHWAFSSWLIMSNFSSIPILFLQFFTWIALHDVDLCFSLILITKANAVESGTHSAAWLYHKCNQSTYVTDGVTVMLLSASLQHKTSSDMDCLDQIALNRKWLCIFCAKLR